jgi:hypothetical protein
MDIKIKAMKAHLKANPKDKSTKRRLEAGLGKQSKMLKYLRRTVNHFFNFKDLTTFLKCCEMLGINPKSQPYIH